MTLQEITPLSDWILLGLMIISAFVGLFILNNEVNRGHEIMDKRWQRHYWAMRFSVVCFFLAFLVYLTKPFV